MTAANNKNVEVIEVWRRRSGPQKHGEIKTMHANDVHLSLSLKLFQLECIPLAQLLTHVIVVIHLQRGVCGRMLATVVLC